ncbi:MAG: hypothetical protein U0822_10140 [Anaerolineae bacterium]
MRTIEVTLTVQPDGTAILELPPDVLPGEHSAVLVIEETAQQAYREQTPEPLQLHTFALTNWAADATFRR